MSWVDRILAKAEQLRLFGGRDVLAPGSRGGRYYRSKRGKVRYGEQPTPELPPVLYHAGRLVDGRLHGRAVDGVFLTDSRAVAERIAGGLPEHGMPASTVFAVHAVMHNPFRPPADEQQFAGSLHHERQWIAAARAGGHDGVIARHREGWTEYIVLDPAQVTLPHREPEPPAPTPIELGKWRAPWAPAVERGRLPAGMAPTEDPTKTIDYPGRADRVEGALTIDNVTWRAIWRPGDVTQADVDGEFEADAVRATIAAWRTFYSSDDVDARAIRRGDGDTPDAKFYRTDATQYATTIFVANNKDIGAGSGGPGSARVFWAPYSLPDRDSRFVSPNGYNSARALGVDPMFVLAHELHHAIGNRSEFDDSSDVMGVLAHCLSGLRHNPAAPAGTVDTWVLAVKFGGGKYAHNAARKLRWLYHQRPREIEALARWSGAVDDGVQWAQVVKRFMAVGKRKPEPSGTERPAFKAWFGDSRVVDSAGEPLVVYHGATADFDAFDLAYSGQRYDKGYLGAGFYFGDKGWGNAYSEREGGRVLPVYLHIAHPLIVHARFDGRREVDREIVVRETLGLPREATAMDVREEAESTGHDGVIYRMERPGDPPGLEYEYVAFYPTQIKSVWNRGTFDPADPDFAKASDVREPGKRGGKFYFTRKGKLRYGAMPTRTKAVGRDDPRVVLRGIEGALENNARLIEVNSPDYSPSTFGDYQRGILEREQARRAELLALLPAARAAAAAYVPPPPPTDAEVELRIQREMHAERARIDAHLAMLADPETPKRWEHRARRTFGLTTDPREAGYVMRDGAMLDFSDKRQGGMRGMRSADHREVGRADEGMKGGTDGMLEFMGLTGAVRLNFSALLYQPMGEPSASLMMHFPPQGASEKQLHRLREIAKRYMIPTFYYDFRDEGGEAKTLDLGKFGEEQVKHVMQPTLAKAADPREPGKISRRAGNTLGVDRRGRIHWRHTAPPETEPGQGALDFTAPPTPEPEPVAVVPATTPGFDLATVKRIVGDEYPRAYERARAAFPMMATDYRLRVLPLRFSERPNQRRAGYLKILSGKPAYIAFPLNVLALDSEAGIRNTVGHEVAHHVTLVLHDNACRCSDCVLDRRRMRRQKYHGEQFRSTMRLMGYDPDRPVEVERGQLPNQVPFHCACSTHYVGKRRGANWIAKMGKLERHERGGASYSCRKCHTRLQPGARPGDTLAKATQLDLFGRNVVQAPGSRGGKYRITPKGEVRYDQAPRPRRVVLEPSMYDKALHARIQSFYAPGGAERFVTAQRAQMAAAGRGDSTRFDRDMEEERALLHELPLGHGTSIEGALAVWREGGIKAKADFPESEAGHTGVADIADGLDRFVFCCHGKRGGSFGDVSIYIDNEALDDPAAFSTPQDIAFSMEPEDNPAGNDPRTGFPPLTKQRYGANMMRGEDHYVALAARRARNRLSSPGDADPSLRGTFEVKLPPQPRSRILGFMTFDTGVRQALIAGGIPAELIWKAPSFTDNEGTQDEIGEKIIAHQRELQRAAHAPAVPPPPLLLPAPVPRDPAALARVARQSPAVEARKRIAEVAAVGDGSYVEDSPVCVRVAHLVADVLSEMRAKGYPMPSEVVVARYQGPGMRGETRFIDRADPNGSSQWTLTTVLEVLLPETLPADADLDLVVASCFGGTIGTIRPLGLPAPNFLDDQVLPMVDKFTVRTMRDIVLHEMGHVLAGRRSRRQIPAYRYFAVASVSNYATKDEDEFMAEAFVRLYRGDGLSPEAATVYAQCNGPEIR